MALFGAFSAATLGMMSQSYRLNAISTNITNTNVGGYKGTEVRFSSLIARDQNGDPISGSQIMGGIRPYDMEQISKPGDVKASNDDRHAAISGRGMFILNTQIDGQGDTYYSRDGGFALKTEGTTTVPGVGFNKVTPAAVDDNGQPTNPITVETAYLVDKNGYYVMGWTPDVSGNFDTSTPNFTALRLDTFAFSTSVQTTTEAMLNLNLSADSSPGDSFTFDMDVFDTNGTLRPIGLRFEMTAARTWEIDLLPSDAASWSMNPGTTTASNSSAGPGPGTEVVFNTFTEEVQVRAAGGGAPVAGFFSATDDYITIAGSGSNNATYRIASVSADGSTVTLDSRTPLIGSDGTDANAITFTTGKTTSTMMFDNKGEITSTSPIGYSVTWNDGATVSVSLDVESMTQLGRDFLPVNYVRNGFAPSDMERFSYDNLGHVVAKFADDTTRDVYRLALADFTVPDRLESVNGMVFRETSEAGTRTVFAPGADWESWILPNAREFSNMKIDDQFSKMIMTQSAYNASANVFRTVDEVIETTRDLKR